MSSSGRYRRNTPAHPRPLTLQPAGPTTQAPSDQAVYSRPQPYAPPPGCRPAPRATLIQLLHRQQLSPDSSPRSARLGSPSRLSCLMACRQPACSEHTVCPACQPLPSCTRRYAGSNPSARPLHRFRSQASRHRSVPPGATAAYRLGAPSSSVNSRTTIHFDGPLQTSVVSAICCVCSPHSVFCCFSSVMASAALATGRNPPSFRLIER